jgi:hypothetical protein
MIGKRELVAYHLASVHVSVGASSVTKGSARVIAMNSHVHAVFIWFHRFRLIRAPGEVFWNGRKGAVGAPTPQPSAPLQTTRPVVPVASPVFCDSNEISKM